MLRPPETCRGMKKLDKSQFEMNVEFPAIEIEGKDLGVISRRVRLEQFLLGHNLKPLKNSIDSETKGMKYLMFHPDKVKNEETKNKILSMLERELGAEKIEQINWKSVAKTLSFENWDSKALIRAVLPEELEYSSYTQTGHIVHCNFTDEILPFRFVIAEILLNKINNCRTVVQKGTILTNVFRNLDLELLAGEEDYVTELKEEGLRYKLDFSKVYWNSRLSHEHSRVISKFDYNSIVYDACCGIGPFVLPAFRKRKPRRIIANDLNPDSVKWLKTNIEINHIKSDFIEVHNMDANEFIRNIVANDALKLMKEGNEEEQRSEIHIVMNLPAYAINFLPAFRGILGGKLDEIPQGNRYKWNVYCYLFAKSHVDVPKDWYEKEARRMVDDMVQWENGSMVEYCHNVRTVSSRKEMFCVQICLPYEYLTAEPLKENENRDEPSCKISKSS